MNLKTYSIQMIFVCHVVTNSVSIPIETKNSNNTLNFSPISAIIKGHKSPMRPFYVQVYNFRDFSTHETCGGALIRPDWVLTIAECICGTKITRVGVQIGDFTDRLKPKAIQPVTERICFSDNPFASAVGLLRLAEPVSVSEDMYFLDVCRWHAKENELLGTCGMGTVSRDHNMEPVTLRELYMLEEKGGFFLNYCPVDEICTSSISTDSLCRGDFGGPLYRFFERTTRPMCVYGVSSYTGNEPDEQEDCIGTHYFANVPFFYDWIVTTIHSHSN
ncbi:chymotrypsin-1-like isoform X2 [Symsagittifera roscoffensis]|uniref:chymotrypsin-1-like isoform X2 n=1 Tax=Symsagittifera roscoffensis TaxID=84072 RepID=UPI00307CBA62